MAAPPPHEDGSFKAVAPAKSGERDMQNISEKGCDNLYFCDRLTEKLPPISQDNNRDNNRSDDDAGQTKEERLFAAIFTNLGRPPRHSGHEKKANVCQPPNRTSLTFWFFLSTIGANKHGGNLSVANGETSATGMKHRLPKNHPIDFDNTPSFRPVQSKLFTCHNRVFLVWADRVACATGGELVLR